MIDVRWYSKPLWSCHRDSVLTHVKFVSIVFYFYWDDTSIITMSRWQFQTFSDTRQMNDNMKHWKKLSTGHVNISNVLLRFSCMIHLLIFVNNTLRKSNACVQNNKRLRDIVMGAAIDTSREQSCALQLIPADSARSTTMSIAVHNLGRVPFVKNYCDQANLILGVKTLLKYSNSISSM